MGTVNFRHIDIKRYIYYLNFIENVSYTTFMLAYFASPWHLVCMISTLKENNNTNASIEKIWNVVKEK